MSLWYAVAIIGALVVSWVISVVYCYQCKQTSRYFSQHGALEFNVSFFGLIFSIMSLSSNKDGTWEIGALGVILLLFVAWRFWKNWEITNET